MYGRIFRNTKASDYPLLTEEFFFLSLRSSREVLLLIWNMTFSSI